MIISVTPELAIDVARNFAGGMGVLEADKFYAAARLGVPYTVITLFYPEGYVAYKNGELTAEDNTLERFERVGESSISVRGEKVDISYYAYKAGSATAIFIKVERPEWAVRATRRLYVEDTEAERFYKYVILAKSAVDYVERFVGWENVKFFDLQEAYIAIAALVKRHPKMRIVIHTPAPWGHPKFWKRFFHNEFGFDFAMDPVVLTELGLAATAEGIVVSRKMVSLTCRTFPHHCHKIRAVTNAVEIPRWQHPKLAGVKSVEELRRRREEIKEEALRVLGINARGKTVISWARRVTRYKRPHFALQLTQELNRDVVFILGGRAHPDDDYGVEIMRQFQEAADILENIYYFPNLDVDTMRKILWATDIWLFTSFSGWEASSTSFMKAGINGVPSVASRDGAVVEVVRDGLNGWLFGPDRDFLLPLKSQEVDGEYSEFRRKVEEALNAVASGKYWEIAFGAYTSFNDYFSMERLFREYGYM